METQFASQAGLVRRLSGSYMDARDFKKLRSFDEEMKPEINVSNESFESLRKDVEAIRSQVHELELDQEELRCLLSDSMKSVCSTAFTAVKE